MPRSSRPGSGLPLMRRDFPLHVGEAGQAEVVSIVVLVVNVGRLVDVPVIVGVGEEVHVGLEGRGCLPGRRLEREEMLSSYGRG